MHELQERADLVLTRGPDQGASVRSINEWLDRRGLDRRVPNSDAAMNTR
jgi:hypothetical protein